MSSALLWVHLIVIGAILASGTRALASPDPLQRAADLFFLDAVPESALAVTRAALQDPSVETPERVSWFVLQARCLVALDRSDEARKSFCEAWQLNPDWHPDETFNRQETDVFLQARRVDCPGDAPVRPEPQMPAEELGGGHWYTKRPVLIGAGAVVVGGIVWAIVGPGKDEWTRPAFPDPPSQ